MYFTSNKLVVALTLLGLILFCKLTVIRSAMFCSIIRHGETNSNAGKIIFTKDGKGGGELTERGILMAKKLGEYIKDENFTKIYSSPYIRARDTTKYILSQLTNSNKSIIIEPLLRERDIGAQWQEKSNKLIDDQVKKDNLPPHKTYAVNMPGCESFIDCKKRAGEFFAKLCELSDKTSETKAENVLVVSHGFFISCLFDYIIENPKLFKMNNFNLDDFNAVARNTCRTRFMIGKKETNGIHPLNFTHFYDTAHLNEL